MLSTALSISSNPTLNYLHTVNTAQIMRERLEKVVYAAHHAFSSDIIHTPASLMR